MVYQEWFKLYETELNKEYCDKNGRGFLLFCKNKFSDEQKR